MFVKKDLRKIKQILTDGQEAIDKNDEEKFLKDLRLGRRQNEFQGSVRILCQPKNAPSLLHLESLSLYDCQIQNLDGIGMLDHCPNLSTLNVGRNPLEQLPEEMSKLSNSLRELLLDDCHLSGPFPKCLLKLENLETLRMSNNNITTLPPEICLLSNLKVLCMDRNQLAEIPKELEDLTELRTLLLRHNKIKELPDGVPGAALLNLTLLHISSNQLTHLPDSLVECTSLTHIYANSNQLEEVPLGLEGLTNLQRLNLSHNNIEYLPTDFRDCFGSPDTDSPEGICVGGTVSNIECCTLEDFVKILIKPSFFCSSCLLNSLASKRPESLLGRKPRNKEGCDRRTCVRHE